MIGYKVKSRLPEVFLWEPFLTLEKENATGLCSSGTWLQVWNGDTEQSDQGIAKISKEVAAEVESAKVSETPVKSIFGGEEYVKVKKSEWSRIVATLKRHLQETSCWINMNRGSLSLKKTEDYLKTRVDKFTNRIKEMKNF